MALEGHLLGGWGRAKCAQRGNLFSDPKNRVDSCFFLPLLSPVPTLLITITRAPLFLSPFEISHSLCLQLEVPLETLWPTPSYPASEYGRDLFPHHAWLMSGPALEPCAWCWVHGYSQLDPPLQKHLPPDFVVFKSTMHINRSALHSMEEERHNWAPHPKGRLGPQFSPTCTVQSC